MMNKIFISAENGKVILKLEDVAIATMTPIQAFEVASDIMTKAKEAKKQNEKEIDDGRKETPPTQPSS